MTKDQIWEAAKAAGLLVHQLGTQKQEDAFYEFARRLGVVVSDERVREAAAAWNYLWPAQLESGVMFYKGLRITRAEFESACKGS